MKFKKIVETCIYSSNLQSMRAFYTNVLGLELVSEEPERSLFFKVGKSMLIVFNPDKTRNKSDSVFPTHGVIPPSEGHLALEIEGQEYEAAKQSLRAKGVEIEKELSWNSSKSAYFRDPAGNLLEIITEGTWPIEP